jgi:hypothetical protein
MHGPGPDYPHAHAHPQVPWSNAPPVPSVLECPVCLAPTKSLKKYTYLSYLIFVWIFGFWSVKHHVACPSCMQKDLLLRLAMNTVLANVLWPLVILPWNGILLVLTFTEGHSKGVEAYARAATGSQ